jgi:hypothetical protein
LRVADELEMLEAGVSSWRTQAADRLRTLAAGTEVVTTGDAPLLLLIAAEVRREEDEGTLRLGLVTWRTLAATTLRPSPTSFARPCRPRA